MTQLSTLSPSSRAVVKKKHVEGRGWEGHVVGSAVLVSWGHLLWAGTRPEALAGEGDGFANYLNIYTPSFFALMGVEYFALKASGWKSTAAQYSFTDSWSSITAGTTQQLVGLSIVNPLIGLRLYTHIWENYRLVDNFNIYGRKEALFAILAIDCGYYWFHRLAHAWMSWWAGHRHHHSSDHYNLTTALRQGWFQPFTSWLNHLPTALFVPPNVFKAYMGLDVLYQFWIHTCVIRRLGFFEWIFNTPSHHRVHHDRRVHKNFAGFLIIWDRMFGSFTDEEDQVNREGVSEGEEVERDDEACLFGVMKEDENIRQCVTQDVTFRQMARDYFNGSRTLFETIFKGPGYFTITSKRVLRDPAPSVPRLRSEKTLAGSGKFYVTAQFLLVLGYYLKVGTGISKMDWTPRALTCGGMLASFYTSGALMDGTWWAKGVEQVRALATGAFCFFLSNSDASEGDMWEGGSRDSMAKIFMGIAAHQVASGIAMALGAIDF